jgi:CRP/FNR family transcriptional regulator, cyclic AMP receptor protein
VFPLAMQDKGGYKPTGEEQELLLVFEPGQVIFQENDLGKEMFLIQRGEVEIERQGHRLGLLRAGDFFGEMSLLEGLPRAATARAHSECALLPIDAAVFDHMLRSLPELGIRMMRKLSGRLRGRLESPELAALQGAMQAEQGQGGIVAVLVHQGTGTELAVPRQRELTLGRPDPMTGLTPDLDLSFAPEASTVSRRHARLVQGPDGFALVEEIGVANGTAVNGKLLSAGKPEALEDGDDIALGSVHLSYRVR